MQVQRKRTIMALGLAGTSDEHRSGSGQTASGAKTFAGLDAMMDPIDERLGQDWMKVHAQRIGRARMTPGDTDIAIRRHVEAAMIGVPTDGRMRTSLRLAQCLVDGGEAHVQRIAYLRAHHRGQSSVLKFLTTGSTFAASWTLKSPPSKDDPVRIPEAPLLLKVPGIDLKGWVLENLRAGRAAHSQVTETLVDGPPPEDHRTDHKEGGALQVGSPPSFIEIRRRHPGTRRSGFPTILPASTGLEKPAAEPFPEALVTRQ